MRIDNKFKVGDYVFFLFDNHINTGLIIRICVEITSCYKSIEYDLDSPCLINKSVYDKKITQDKCFATKEELRQSLK